MDGYPYLRYWCKSSRDTYTVALEPASYLFDGFTDSKRMGAYWRLEPGESRSVWIHCDIFTG